MAAPTSGPGRMRTVQATALLLVLLGVSTIITYPSSILYIQSNHALPPMPRGACYALSGPVSDSLGLDAVVALAYVEGLVLSPFSILSGVLIWRMRKLGGIIAVPVAITLMGITLIGCAAPYGAIFIVQLWLIHRIWTRLQ